LLLVESAVSNLMRIGVPTGSVADVAFAAAAGASAFGRSFNSGVLEAGFAGEGFDCCAKLLMASSRPAQIMTDFFMIAPELNVKQG
jgi:hypothetical protein